MSKNRFAKIAVEVWERLAESTGGRIDPDEYKDELLSELLAHNADEELVEDYAQKLAVAETNRRVSAGVPGQLDLLTGEEADLDAYWRVGGSLIQVRSVVRDELLAKLAQEDEDLARKQVAGAKRKREAAALLPLMADPTTTLGEATIAYRRSNPDA